MSFIAGFYRNFVFDKKVKTIIKKQRKLIADVADDTKTANYEGREDFIRRSTEDINQFERAMKFLKKDRFMCIPCFICHYDFQTKEGINDLIKIEDSITRMEKLYNETGQLKF